MADGASEPVVRLTHRQILWVYSGLMVGMLLAALDQMIVATALPVIAGDLSGISQAAWIISAYLLTSTAATPLYGKISDLYGRRPVFQAAIIIFTLGSVLAGVSQTMLQLVAARAVQGIGAGGLFAMTQAIVADILSPRERGRYQGIMGVVHAFASVSGPLLGGLLVDHFSWRWIFLINPPIAAVALVVTSLVLRLPARGVRHAIDYLGAALLVAGVMLVLLALEWGGTEYPWGAPQVLGPAAAALLLLALLLRHERRASEPILPLGLFGQATFTLSCGVLFASGLATNGAITFVPALLQLVQHATATNAGLVLLPMNLGWMANSVLSGRLITRTGRYKVFPVLGMLFLATAMILIARIGPATSGAFSAVALVTLGFGAGFTNQVMLLAVQNVVEYRVLGTATATATFFRSMGGAVGVALMGAILSNQLDHDLALLPPLSTGTHLTASTIRGTPAAIYALPAVERGGVVLALGHAMHVVFLCVVPVMLVGLALALRIRETPLRRWRGDPLRGQATPGSGRPAALPQESAATSME